MVRVFIAVEPTKDLQIKIANAGNTLRGAGQLSLVQPNLMHITLKFFGEVEESNLSKITQVLDEIDAKPFTLSVTGVSTFGRPPRVIKTEVHDNGATSTLAKEIDTRASALGFPREAKEFSPHITIARVKEYSPALKPKIDELKNMDFGACEINEILLKKSVLTPKGPIYTTVHKRSL